MLPEKYETANVCKCLNYYQCSEVVHEEWCFFLSFFKQKSDLGLYGWTYWVLLDVIQLSWALFCFLLVKRTPAFLSMIKPPKILQLSRSGFHFPSQEWATNQNNSSVCQKNLKWNHSNDSNQLWNPTVFGGLPGPNHKETPRERSGCDNRLCKATSPRSFIETVFKSPWNNFLTKKNGQNSKGKSWVPLEEYPRYAYIYIYYIYTNTYHLHMA